MPRIHVKALRCALLGVLLTSCGKVPETAPATPPVVFVATATQADAPLFHETIATMDGSVDVQIHSPITGYLIRQDYREGSLVKKNEVLFVIDPKPFRAELENAETNLANKQAGELRTKQNLDRYATLVTSGAVSQQEFQTQVQNNLSAQAEVAVARAAVQSAKMKLGCIQVISPIDGVAGRAIPGLGDLISPTTSLTTISTLDPIQAEFNLPRQFYMDNADRFAKVMAIPLAERPDDLELILPNGVTYAHRGKFNYLNQVVTSPGAVTAYAVFPNPESILRPGQYARIRGVASTVSPVVLIPQICVTQLQGSGQVMVVKADNTVEVRTVTLGDVAGSYRMVNSGLTPGEKVVAEGIQKCAQGITVEPQPYLISAPTSPTASTNSPAATTSPGSSAAGSSTTSDIPVSSKR